MSRIQYTIEHKNGLEKLHKAVIDVLNKLLKLAVRSANLSLRAKATLAPDASAGEQSPVDEREIASGKNTLAMT